MHCSSRSEGELAGITCEGGVSIVSCYIATLAQRRLPSCSGERHYPVRDLFLKNKKEIWQDSPCAQAQSLASRTYIRRTAKIEHILDCYVAEVRREWRNLARRKSQIASDIFLHQAVKSDGKDTGAHPALVHTVIPR